MSTKHQLVNGTLWRKDDGIHALCTCGWDSGPRFSSMLASVAFEDHREEQTADKIEGMGGDAVLDRNVP